MVLSESAQCLEQNVLFVALACILSSSTSISRLLDSTEALILQLLFHSRYPPRSVPIHLVLHIGKELSDGSSAILCARFPSHRLTCDLVTARLMIGEVDHGKQAVCFSQSALVSAYEPFVSRNQRGDCFLLFLVPRVDEHVHGWQSYGSSNKGSAAWCRIWTRRLVIVASLSLALPSVGLLLSLEIHAFGIFAILSPRLGLLYSHLCRWTRKMRLQEHEKIWERENEGSSQGSVKLASC